MCDLQLLDLAAKVTDLAGLTARVSQLLEALQEQQQHNKQQQSKQQEQQHGWQSSHGHDHGHHHQQQQQWQDQHEKLQQQLYPFVEGFSGATPYRTRGRLGPPGAAATALTTTQVAAARTTMLPDHHQQQWQQQQQQGPNGCLNFDFGIDQSTISQQPAATARTQSDMLLQQVNRPADTPSHERYASQAVLLQPPRGSLTTKGDFLEVSIHSLGSDLLESEVRGVFPEAPRGAAVLAAVTFQFCGVAGDAVRRQVGVLRNGGGKSGEQQQQQEKKKKSSVYLGPAVGGVQQQQRNAPKLPQQQQQQEGGMQFWPAVEEGQQQQQPPVLSPSREQSVTRRSEEVSLVRHSFDSVRSTGDKGGGCAPAAATSAAAGDGGGGGDGCGEASVDEEEMERLLEVFLSWQEAVREQLAAR